MSKKCLINDEMLECLKECIGLGMSYSATCSCLQISEETFYNYMRRGKEGKAPYSLFFQAVRQSEAQLMKDCLTKLRKVADTGSLESIKFILERRFPKDWSKAENFNINAKTESVNVNVSPSLTEAENNKLRAEILSKLSPKPFPPRLNISEEAKQYE